MTCMNSNLNLHFVYQLICRTPDGKIKWQTEPFKNRIPTEGELYIRNAAFASGSQFGSWYVGLYSGAYTPQPTDTMATIASAATEITTAYSESTRQLLVPDTASGGMFKNSASPAVFTFTADTTVRGVVLSSNSTKGGTTGVLASVALASAPKAVANGEVLNVIAGLDLASS